MLTRYTRPRVLSTLLNCRKAAEPLGQQGAFPFGKQLDLGQSSTKGNGSGGSAGTHKGGCVRGDSRNRRLARNL